MKLPIPHSSRIQMKKKQWHFQVPMSKDILRNYVQMQQLSEAVKLQKSTCSSKEPSKKEICTKRQRLQALLINI